MSKYSLINLKETLILSKTCNKNQLTKAYLHKIISLREILISNSLLIQNII